MVPSLALYLESWLLQQWMVNPASTHAVFGWTVWIEVFPSLGMVPLLTALYYYTTEKLALLLCQRNGVNFELLKTLRASLFLVYERNFQLTYTDLPVTSTKDVLTHPPDYGPHPWC